MRGKVQFLGTDVLLLCMHHLPRFFGPNLQSILMYYYQEAHNITRDIAVGKRRDYCKMDLNSLAFFSKVEIIQDSKYGTSII